REAVNERACHLALDLRRVHRIARIGSADDTMDLHLVAVAHRDLGRACHVAIEGLEVREAAIDAFRRRLAPADLLGHRVQHTERARALAEKLAPELERILPG